MDLLVIINKWTKYLIMNRLSFVIILLLTSSVCFAQQLWPRMDNATGKYGYVDSLSQWVISPCFDHAKKFEGDYAMVTSYHNGDANDRRYGFINKKGDLIVKPIYHKVSGPFDGLFRVQQRSDEEWFFLNEKGKKAFKKGFYYVGDFHCGFAVFAVKDKDTSKVRYGYINRKGNVVIEPIFAFAYNYKDGYGKVAAGEQFQSSMFGYFDDKGEIVVPCWYTLEIADIELEKYKNSLRQE